MRILFIAEAGGLPNDTGSGNRLIRWSLLSALISCGLEAGFLYIDPKSERLTQHVDLRRTRRLLEEAGCSLWYFPGIANFLEQKGKINKVIQEYAPDFIYAYGSVSFRYIDHTLFRGKTALASIDVEFLPDFYRIYINSFYGSMGVKLRTFFTLPSKMKKMLACYLICHAGNHMQWLQKTFKKPCLYTPNPVVKVATQHPRECNEKTMRPRFLLVGGLQGIATLSGIYYFAHYILPHLLTALKRNQIEIHLIGKGSLDPSVKRQFLRYGITLRGYISSLEDEFKQARAMIVPTPIKLGFRTRILDAFRYKLPVIAHTSNKAGMPELHHEKNSLLADNPKDFATYILKCANDQSIPRRLAENAYKEFIDSFNADEVAKKIISFLNGNTILEYPQKILC